MMSDYMMEECKDEVPVRTIQRIKGILSGLGISLVEENIRSTSNTFTTKLFLKGTGIGSQGKGVSRAFSRASAYGELIERLQNMILADPFHVSDDVQSEGMFRFAPDEKKLRGAELDHFREKYGAIYGLQEDSSVPGRDPLRKWLLMSPQESGYTALPFCSLIDGRVQYIPWQFLSLYRSNGMCAGNTPAEALVQGLSEILERYVNKVAITEELTPPEVPWAYVKKFRRPASVIRQIEGAGGYRVIVKDFSLGKRLPVLGVILISLKDQSYMVNFGAHPDFGIALERCLTEALQSYKLDDRLSRSLLPFRYLKRPLAGHVNFTNSVRVGRGNYPGALFVGRPSYAFVPWRESARDNELLLRGLLELVKGLGVEVLVRDKSLLGFPAFQVLAPGFSEIEDKPEKFLAFALSRKEAGEIIRDMRSASDEDCAKLISYITSRLPYIMDCRNLSGFLNFPVKYGSVFDAMSVPMFLARLCFRKGDMSGAHAVLNSVVSRAEGRGGDGLLRLKCTRDYLAALKEGTDPKTAGDLLKYLYPHAIVRKTMCEWKRPDTVFKNFPVLPCMDCRRCCIRKECLRMYFAALYGKLKAKMGEKPLDQSSLAKFSLENGNACHISPPKPS